MTLQTCYFGNFENASILVSTCSKLSFSSACKKSTEQTCYFRYFGHAWPHTLKMMYQFEKTFNVYQKAKKQLQLSCFPCDIVKIL